MVYVMVQIKKRKEKINMILLVCDSIFKKYYNLIHNILKNCCVDVAFHTSSVKDVIYLTDVNLLLFEICRVVFIISLVHSAGLQPPCVCVSVTTDSSAAQ